MIKSLHLHKCTFILSTILLSGAVYGQTVAKVDTGVFPKAEKNQKKVVIEVPHSSEDNNKKIEIFVGKNMETDKCNRYSLTGIFTSKDLKGWGYNYLVFNSNGNAVSTMMGCAEKGTRNQFVHAAGYLMDYNGRIPVVLYVPEGFDVKYKIYKADTDFYEAPEVFEKK
ncbi:MAG: ecotin family protein [Flavobacteriia bacterium]|nr:ecotin family protein [Flavobacteriia bacterium]MBH2023777.1 ecotin family protein [Flavobacteriales bacterium]